MAALLDAAVVVVILGVLVVGSWLASRWINGPDGVQDNVGWWPHQYRRRRDGRS